MLLLTSGECNLAIVPVAIMHCIKPCTCVTILLKGLPLKC